MINDDAKSITMNVDVPEQMSLIIIINPIEASTRRTCQTCVSREIQQMPSNSYSPLSLKVFNNASILWPQQQYGINVFMRFLSAINTNTNKAM
ncbi:hypothetical protein E6O75_ATG11227 [Venturia nashicola]|uniref:Uncharacterized protein n=1 Tax=Venturia nashicola TaxID=86259 RepID=A0A4Z1P1J4_9PEZI|nr:hypothetical protein E6O75_ATG11227 [Venturia nashicola]